MAVVQTVCLGNQFRFQLLCDYLLQQNKAAVYRDVIYLQRPEGCIILFSFGCLVTWDLDEIQRRGFEQQLTPYIEGQLAEVITDEFTYEVGTQSAIKNDHITLPDDSPLARIAFSFALAQSVKLNQFEVRANLAIEQTAWIPQHIAKTGESGLSRKELARMRGHLFSTEVDINLRFDLLDTPEFFWEYPELQGSYELGIGYLELSQRIEILNKRLSVISDMLGMLAEEQKHKHSSLLEWIIIWLIAVEVVIFFAHDIFALF